MEASVKFLPTLMVMLGITTLTGFAAWLRMGPKWMTRLVDVLALLCLAGALGVWSLRLKNAGHLPIFGTFESSLSLVVTVLLVATVYRRFSPLAGTPWPLATGVAAALLAHGMRYDPTIYALTISERSWVVDVHSIVAWVAFGVLTVNAAFALYLILPRRSDESGEQIAASRRLLSTTLSLGFLLHTGMLISGSFYKFLLFGKVWSFDPIETLAFVTWISYGTLLHLHLMAKWDGRRLAGWCLTVFVILVVSYRGIVYFPAWSTYHIFDMNLRTHLTGSEGEPE
jgi:ABC-type transport system involved in cytochrome c biogenesis permease subunit